MEVVWLSIFVGPDCAEILFGWLHQDTGCMSRCNIGLFGCLHMACSPLLVGGENTPLVGCFSWVGKWLREKNCYLCEL